MTKLKIDQCLESLPLFVEQTLKSYLCLDLGKKCVPCPYLISTKPEEFDLVGLIDNYFRKIKRSVDRTGKGTPEEIIEVTRKLANEKGFDLNNASIAEVRKFMRRKGIGVDCSGFAYQLLNSIDFFKGGSGIEGRLIRKQSRNPLSFLREDRLQINADLLTSKVNSFQILKVKDMQLGDMIRMQGGKHLLVVLCVFLDKNDEGKIVYVHSSSKKTSEVSGVHLERIKILKASKGLEYQEWEERTREKKNYGKEYFHPESGDGVFRLKIWKK